MRRLIRTMVKMREAFRPFAPAVSLEQSPDWFEIPGIELPYVITTVDVRDPGRESLSDKQLGPAVKIHRYLHNRIYITIYYYYMRRLNPLSAFR